MITALQKNLCQTKQHWQNCWIYFVIVFLTVYQVTIGTLAPRKSAGGIGSRESGSWVILFHNPGNCFFFVAVLECKYIMFKDTVFWWFQKLFWLQNCKIKPKLGKQIISKFFKFKLKQTHTRGNILLFCNTMYDVLSPRTWPSSAWRLTTLSLVARR